MRALEESSQHETNDDEMPALFLNRLPHNFEENSDLSAIASLIEDDADEQHHR